MRPLPKRLLLAAALAAGALPRAHADQGNQADEELRRYGFSRELSRTHVRPKSASRRIQQVPGGEAVPKPRKTVIPDRNQTFRPPAPPPGAEPLVLQPAPGGVRVPTGQALIPAPQDGDGPARYVGDTTCLGCHKQMGENPETNHVGLSRHSASLPAARRGCEGCHGPGGKHFGDPRFIVNPAKQDPKVASRTCLDCHKMQGLVDPHGWFFSRHASARLSCTTCHQIHGTDRADLLRAEPDDLCIACHGQVARKLRMRSHHPTRATGVQPLRSQTRGKVACVDCHDPHGSRGDHRGMLRDEPEATCARCHPGHGGPWVFPHVTEREGGGCLACHQPHGSPNRNLLRSRGRTSCIQCHSDRITHFPSQGCNTSSCHTDVHGSNKHPLFFR